ncbi:family 43 glycosylhydrolase [Formosa haliotis]|uniref:family 43 glycosylhydrolase n=1 Tax=Formosa haliotis TaxID=1555194 RepID=UPI000826614C|nr:family 43 glycosylhydrolase [Formosa haliotis]
MNKGISLFIAAFIALLAIPLHAQQRRSNPIVSHMFTADASAHVWDDGRLYVYPSTDVAPAKGYSTMDGYHVFSTDDMITWKDHGEILHSKDVSWGIEKGGFMWAPDCVFKDGRYYFYFPHKNKEKVWEIGVATSKNPASGFKVQGFVKGGNAFCDPNVFIDDDGQAYLFAVRDAKCYGAKLKNNMIEVESEMVHQEGVDEHREGPFVFKRNDLYYMIYPNHLKPQNQMCYSMSKSPLGPWKPQGVLMDHTDVITMHGSVVEFKNQWYLFYHNGSLSGAIGPQRSICFDPVYFNEDGTMKMVNQTLGVKEPTFHKEVNFNGMFGTLTIGSYKKSDLEKHHILPNAISSIQIPEGYSVECFEKDNFKGKSWMFKEDRIDLSALGCDNVISSIKISKIESDNLVKNPSFELATQKTVKYWKSKTVDCTNQLDETATGYYSLQYKGKGTPADIIQQVDLEPNTSYQLSVMLKVKAGTKGKVIFDTTGTLDSQCKFELGADTKADDWQTFKGTFNSGDLKKLNLRCTTTEDFDGVAYWDNVVLVEKNK